MWARTHFTATFSPLSFPSWLATPSISPDSTGHASGESEWRMDSACWSSPHRFLASLGQRCESWSPASRAGTRKGQGQRPKQLTSPCPRSSPSPKPPGHAHGIPSLPRTLSTGPPSDQGRQPGALSGASGCLGCPCEAPSKAVSNSVLCVLLHIHICLVFTTAMRNQ